MSAIEEFSQYVEQHVDEISQSALEIQRPVYHQLGPLDDDFILDRIKSTIQVVMLAVNGNDEPLSQTIKQSIRTIAEMPHASIDIVRNFDQATSTTLLKTAEQAFPDDVNKQLQVKQALLETNARTSQERYKTYVQVREEKLQQREQELTQLQDELENVSAAVRELSSPIVPIHDNILVLPLVGSIDTNRAQSITEDLLEEIVERQSDIVILDITGVPLVDTSIANYLLQTTKAVSLLGAEVILVGISAEVAQTIVGLDIDLRQLAVRANLQDGFAYALEQVGLGILPLRDYATSA